MVEASTKPLPAKAAEFDKHAILSFEIDKSFYKVNRLPTIYVNMRPGGKGGSDIEFVRDKMEGKKRFDAMT